MNVSRANLADYSRRVRPLVRLGEIQPTQSGAAWHLSASEDDVPRYRLTSNTVETSLREWVEATQPAILFEHEERSREKGDPRQEHGYVVGVLRLSEPEARSRGIDSQSGEWLYAELACAPDLVELLDEGRVRGTSPTLELGYVDDEGRDWPIVLRELSFVAEPRLRTQPRAAEVDSAALSDPGGRMARKMNRAARAKLLRHASTCAIHTKTGGRLVGRGVASLADAEDLEPGEILVVTDESGEPIATGTVEEIVEVAEEIEAAAEAGAGMTEPGEDDASMEDAESRLAKVEEVLARIMEHLDMASMSDRPKRAAKPSELQQLREKVQYMEAREQVRAELCDREIPAGGEERLIRMRLSDPGAYTFAASLLPRRKAPAQRVGLGDPVAANPNAALAGRVRQIAAEKGIPYHEARSLALREVNQ